ncbi:MAG: hypothetical protein C4522_12095 [Desulfobacteraceae bacterium]|nr:MAG: hypothetical protein C4522_12095 [Desulfobacteraceae bacterium]
MSRAGRPVRFAVTGNNDGAFHFGFSLIQMCIRQQDETLSIHRWFAGVLIRLPFNIIYYIRDSCFCDT